MVRVNIKPLTGPAGQTAGRLWELGHGTVDVSMRSSVIFFLDRSILKTLYWNSLSRSFRINLGATLNMPFP